VKLKIAYFLASNSRGGLEMNQVRNAAWMQERGHLVLFICLAGSPVEQLAIEHQLPIRHVKQHRKYYDVQRGKELADLLKSEGVSHLIIRSTSDMSVAVIAKRKLKQRLHLSYFMEMQLGVRKTNFLHTFRFRHFDLWSCPLNWLQEQVITMTRFPKARTHVIPSGLDLRDFDIACDQQAARNLLDLPIDGVLFGLIGRFDPQKGQVLLLDALVQSRHVDFRVVLLGEPTLHEGETYFAAMQELIRINQLEDRVFIRPFRKDIATFYRAIDWFVMASKAETFGMVTIEAMACGTPTIGSNAGGTPELLKQGELGVLFQTQNASDLAQKIDEIMEGKHKIDPNALKQEAQRFDHSTICLEIETLLHLNS
jgi:glycosyltransferase involved in cell wall biosynthesis